MNRVIFTCLLVMLTISQAGYVIVDSDISRVKKQVFKATYGRIRDANIKVLGISKPTVIPNNSNILFQIAWVGLINRKDSKVYYFNSKKNSHKITADLPSKSKVSFNIDDKEIEKLLMSISSVKKPDWKLLPTLKIDSKKTDRKFKRNSDPEPHNHEKNDADSRHSFNYYKRISAARNALEDDKKTAIDIGKPYNTEYNKSTPAYSNIDNRLLEKILDKKNTQDPVSKEHHVEPKESGKICEPRIDIINKKVVIQVWDHGKCIDSSKNYLIKKDYRCSECKDYIDIKDGFAYLTYQLYWEDNSSEKHIVDTKVKVSKKHKFKLQKNYDACDYIIDISKMIAKPQYKLLYLNDNDKEQVIHECKADELSQDVAINEDYTSCELLHDYDNEWTLRQSAGVFKKNGKRIEAFGCRPIGDPIKHKYDEEACEQSIGDTSRGFNLMCRRYIEIEGRKIFISDCHPYGDTNMLSESLDGCDDFHQHIFDKGYTEIYKRWFYMQGLEKKYITDCKKSNEKSMHSYETVDYLHDDILRISKPINNIYVNINGEGKKIIREFSEVSVQPDIPYENTDVVDEESESYSYVGCFKITKTNRMYYYKRADGSIFKEYKGIGRDHKSENLCVTTQEYQEIYSFTEIFKNRKWCRRKIDDPEHKLVDGTLMERLEKNRYVPCYTPVKYRRRYQKQSREVVHFPNGDIVNKSWVDEGIPYLK